MPEMIPPLELEKFLNDDSKLLILHTLDGEIWGASRAATELLGYSNDEIRQMYLANIKPKTLRLSDVCKTQKAEDAPVIFERRNGRRFAAKLETKMIRTTLLRMCVDLVFLELTIVSLDSVSAPKSGQFNIHEVTDYIDSLSAQTKAPVARAMQSIAQLQKSTLTDQQMGQLENLKYCLDQIDFISESVTDSVKIGVNALELERQPFNLVDMLGELTENLAPLLQDVSIAIDPEVPELIYGDSGRLHKLCYALARQSIQDMGARQVGFLIDLSKSESGTDSIKVTMRAQVAHRNNCVTVSIDDRFKAYYDSPAIFICKSLLRIMSGSIRMEMLATKELEVTFSLSLPEVHDLGLQSNRKFLVDSSVALFEQGESVIADQITLWGGDCQKFSNVQTMFEAVEKNIETLVVLKLLDNDDIDQTSLSRLLNLKSARILVITPSRSDIDVPDHVLTMPSPYQVWMLGNILSQFVSSALPFPYSNISRSRQAAIHSGNKRVLVVDANESTRQEYKMILEKNALDVDIAVNGIDSVLACSHNHYDLIFMDSDLPYMDGFEAVAHIRKISSLNLSTPVVILSDDDCPNIQLTVEQVGAAALLEKPLSVNVLLESVEKYMNGTGEVKLNGHTPEKDRHRRSTEVVDAAERSVAPVDTEIIQRLENDTTKDTCREMMDMFIEESLISIYKLEGCCKTGDWQSVAKHAHDLCSSAKTFGCEALHEVAKKLEVESRNNNLSECLTLSTQLPQIFLTSQKGLYDICNRKLD